MPWCANVCPGVWMRMPWCVSVCAVVCKCAYHGMCVLWCAFVCAVVCKCAYRGVWVCVLWRICWGQRKALECPAFSFRYSTVWVQSVKPGSSGSVTQVPLPVEPSYQPLTCLLLFFIFFDIEGSMQYMSLCFILSRVPLFLFVCFCDWYDFIPIYGCILYILKCISHFKAFFILWLAHTGDCVCFCVNHPGTQEYILLSLVTAFHESGQQSELWSFLGEEMLKWMVELAKPGALQSSGGELSNSSSQSVLRTAVVERFHSFS